MGWSADCAQTGLKAANHAAVKEWERRLGNDTDQEATMHIHPNSSLLLASQGVGREEAQIRAKNAAEVRRKLSGAVRALESGGGEEFRSAARVEGSAYGGDHRAEGDGGSGDSFGRLLSVKA